MIVVKIVPNTRGNPAAKLADAELHFHAGPLEGLKLAGFAVWEHANGVDLTVTFPSRDYTVNGEKRSFVLLRPIDASVRMAAVRELILDAYGAHELTSL